MKNFQRLKLDNTTSKFIFVVLLSVVYAFIFYPNLFLLKASPMHQTTWELIDPLVSVLNFIPGIDLLKYELFTNHNLLWSSLKNFGTPILANEIQVAPIFPLTLALIWLPDPYFWNVFVILRLILLGMGSLLLGRGLLSLSWFGSLIFMMIFVYDPLVSRYMNHPWSNGLMASVWLMYFISATLLSQNITSNEKFYLKLLGITISTYSVITSGFPEAMAMGLILVILIFVVCSITIFRRKNFQTALQILALVFFAGIAGASIASPQIFAIMEYLQTVPAGFREGFGAQQFSNFKDFYKIIARFQEEKVDAQLIEILGLVPSALFLFGIVNVKYSYVNNKIPTLVATLAILFYIFKAFPLWPLFNQIVSSLPVLNQSWFPVYYYPIFLFGFAFFSARGAELLFTITSLRMKVRNIFIVLFSIVLVVLVEYLAIRNFQFTLNWYLLLSNALFLLFIFITYDFYRNSRTYRVTKSYTHNFLLILIIGATICLDRPSSFLEYSDGRYHELRALRDIGGKIFVHPELKKIDKSNFRDSTSEGSSVFSGLGSVDNGAPAILSTRAIDLRTALFKTEWNGFLPISGLVRDDAFKLIGRNIEIAVQPASSEHSSELLLLTHKNRSIYYDPSTVGRVYLPSKCILATDSNHAKSIIANSSQLRLGEVILEGQEGHQLKDFCNNNIVNKKGFKQLIIVKDEGASIEIEKVTGPALVVVNDSYYDGWQAKDMISNMPLNIYPANINFKAIFVPENRIYEFA